MTKITSKNKVSFLCSSAESLLMSDRKQNCSAVSSEQKVDIGHL